METTLEQSRTEIKNDGRNSRTEGPIAKRIEEQTAKLPSDTFLWTSVAVMSTSLILKLLKKDHIALFIGQWAAPFLLFGIYNKIVKLEGHDQTDRGR
jgi:hypothetical protein